MGMQASPRLREPTINLEEGTTKEHLEMADSKISFTTPNSGITTTPELEFNLVTKFNGPGGKDIKVSGTRRCPHKGKPQEDRRTLRPISFYKALEKLAQAELTWVEIVVLVLYTGPLYVLCSGILRGRGTCGKVNY